MADVVAVQPRLDLRLRLVELIRSHDGNADRAVSDALVRFRHRPADVAAELDGALAIVNGALNETPRQTIDRANRAVLSCCTALGGGF